jgi:hypothetical protein
MGEWMYRSTFFLTSILAGGEWSGSRTCRFSPEIGGFVDARADLDDVEKILDLTRTRTPTLGRPARSQSLYNLSYPGSYVYCNKNAVNCLYFQRCQYCNRLAQIFAKQRLGKQTSTEGLLSVRSALLPLLRNTEVSTSLRQLVDARIGATWDVFCEVGANQQYNWVFCAWSVRRLYNATLVRSSSVQFQTSRVPDEAVPFQMMNVYELTVGTTEAREHSEWGLGIQRETRGQPAKNWRVIRSDLCVTFADCETVIIPVLKSVARKWIVKTSGNRLKRL